MPFPKLPIAILVFVLAGCLSSVSAAQDLDELSALVPGSLAAMKEHKWEEALQQLTRATAMKTGEALSVYGPQYGVVWYRRGICEMKLQRWDAAIHSFETCYRDFPNRGSSGGNLCQTKALLKWGESAVGAKRWDLAISRFQKFLEERDKVHDVFNQGVFHVTLGVCHYRLGRIPEGNEQLEIAIRNRQAFPTSADQIIAGIHALVVAAIEGKNEAALLDFISNNQAFLVLETEAALACAPVFLKLASDASAAGMYRACLALYEQVPDPAAAAQRLKSALEAPAADKPALQAALRRLEDDARGGSPIGLLKLAGMASAVETIGNRSAACEIRARIAREYPESPLNSGNVLRLTSLRQEMALAAEREGRTDHAIAGYETAWMEGKGACSARAVKRWMELLWERNREGDRLSACRGGLSFLESTNASELGISDEERTARDEVAVLTGALRTALSPQPRSIP